MHYTLYRVEDDGTTSEVSRHNDLFTGIEAGKYAVEVEDYDFAYCLHTDDDVRISTFGKGRIGYREWARRTGRLQDELIHSLDDKYDHDVDMLMS